MAENSITKPTRLWVSLEGAIAKKAESLYVNLNEEDQRRIQQIFLRLVRPGEGEADTRRRATVARNRRRDSRSREDAR